MLTGYKGLKLNLTTTYKNKTALALENVTFMQMKYETKEFSKNE